MLKFVAILLALNCIQFFRNRWLASRRDYFEDAFKNELENRRQQTSEYNTIEAENRRFKDKIKGFEEREKNQRPSDPWILRDSPDDGLSTPSTEQTILPSGRRDPSSSDDDHG